jgi:hypothetical protein
MVRLRRRKRTGSVDESIADQGVAAKLPAYMLDFESWRTHRAETAPTRDIERIAPVSTPTQPLDGLND